MPFQLSIMFGSKAGAYPGEAPLRCTTLGQGPGLTHKHWCGGVTSTAKMSRATYVAFYLAVTMSHWYKCRH